MQRNKNLVGKENSFSFRCPVHQSPCSIAHTFNYEPYISLKIDGVFFEEITNENNNYYYPIFPDNWIKIEGERYERPGKEPIYYIFYLEVKDKVFASLDEMYEEIENYFLSQITEHLTFDYLVSDNIQLDILNNIQQSLKWCDQFSNKKTTLRGLLWFPKKYWKLDCSSWNNYIDQLNDIYNYVNSKLITKLINHDGLVISPNKQSKKKSLVKLKPKNDLTIDLYFTGRDFCSRERTSYKYLIGKNSMILERNSVYRIAPDPSNNGRFIPVYKRELGKKANPDNIITDILYKYNNYFQIEQLKNQYINPWYSTINEDRLNEVIPLFEYTQSIYNKVIPHMSHGIVYDIGCGSMGQYNNHFLNDRLIKYIGFDIDLAKLHEAQVKVKYNTKFAFMLMDITKKWTETEQNNKKNNLWKTYYSNLVNINQQADNIISVFSSQYANISTKVWSNYVNEINMRAKSGTRLFIMWIDYSKINNCETSEYYSYDKDTNQLTVNLPHRPEHTEPGLGEEIFNSFNNHVSTKDKWIVDNTIMKSIDTTFKSEYSISKYMNLVNFIVLIKE